jgi:hypothetical protein
VPSSLREFLRAELLDSDGDHVTFYVPDLLDLLCELFQEWEAEE